VGFFFKLFFSDKNIDESKIYTLYREIPIFVLYINTNMLEKIVNWKVQTKGVALINEHYTF